MKKNLLKSKTMALIIATAFVGASSGIAQADILYDQNVTNNAIFGSGNANGSYTTDRAGGVELGLRGKLRHNASGSPENTFNSNGDGTYSFPAGVAPTQSGNTGVWSFEWSINTDFDGSSGLALNDLTYQLSLDTDSSLGTNFFTFDLINDPDPTKGQTAATRFWDHSMGDNSTGQGDGTESTDSLEYTSNIDTFSLAQNSWKAVWYIPGYDPTVDGTYDIQLAAFDTNGELARSSIQIIQGAGGIAPVPEPASLALWTILGIGGIAAGRKRRKNK